MSIEEFEKIERLKKHFRQQAFTDILKEVSDLKYCQPGTPRNGETVDIEDDAYQHALNQVRILLEKKIQ